MTFFIDHNLSPSLAKGMEGFEEPVTHLTFHFQPDVEDTTWLEFIGKNGWFLITRDDRIRRNPLELLAFRQHKVGAFFLGGKGRKRCELIQQLVRNWPRIKEYARNTRRPFAYRVPPKGTKFGKIVI
jgi:hypothetical protein